MTFIIAEVGSNWLNMNDALESVAMAAGAGAHAVKFQWFCEQDLYGTGSTDTNLTEAQIEDLATAAAKNKIEFMCTVFHHKRVKDINKYVRRHKIASSEMQYHDLIDATLETGKPVIISTGGHEFDDVERLVYDKLLEKDFSLLYCCNAYPSTMHDLRWIGELRDSLSCDVGFSDHSTDVFSAYVAAKHYGATTIEKHVKLREDMDTPDSAHSITFDKLRMLVDAIEHNKRLDFLNHEERDATTRHNRRLVATRALNIGDALQYGRNFGMYRARQDCEGLGAKWIDLVHDTRATTHYKPGDVIRDGGFK